MRELGLASVFPWLRPLAGPDAPVLTLANYFLNFTELSFRLTMLRAEDSLAALFDGLLWR